MGKGTNLYVVLFFLYSYLYIYSYYKTVLSCTFL